MCIRDSGAKPLFHGAAAGLHVLADPVGGGCGLFTALAALAAFGAFGAFGRGPFRLAGARRRFVIVIGALEQRILFQLGFHIGGKVKTGQLQLSSLDLAAYVEAELEKNPLLERANDDDEAPAGAGEPEGSASESAESGEGGEGGEEAAAASDWIGQDMETSRSSMEEGLGTAVSYTHLTLPTILR